MLRENQSVLQPTSAVTTVAKFDIMLRIVQRKHMNATVDDMECDVRRDNDNDAHIFHQDVGDNLSKHWVLLDNQSTLDPFVNANYLMGILTVHTPITVYCNAGSTSTNQKGSVESLLCACKTEN